jgi:hypothetical protein
MVVLVSALSSPSSSDTIGYRKTSRSVCTRMRFTVMNVAITIHNMMQQLNTDITQITFIRNLQTMQQAYTT